MAVAVAVVGCIPAGKDLHTDPGHHIVRIYRISDSGVDRKKDNTVAGAAVAGAAVAGGFCRLGDPVEEGVRHTGIVGQAHVVAVAADGGGLQVLVHPRG